MRPGLNPKIPINLYIQTAHMYMKRIYKSPKHQYMYVMVLSIVQHSSSQNFWDIIGKDPLVHLASANDTIEE
jgi:hypothetical protein